MKDKRFIAISIEDAEKKHASELPLAFSMTEKALNDLLPNVKVTIKDKSLEALDGLVTLDPVIYDKPRIGAIQETAGWQVNVVGYTMATREQPEDYFTIDVGEPSNYIEAVKIFVKTIFHQLANNYWDRIDDEHFASSWEQNLM